eukprot:2196691-Amphidinium_carterae.1
MLRQEMIQRSYVKFHPTTGYDRRTSEIRLFYDGFEIYNWMNPRRLVDDQDNDCTATTLQQLAISYHYAPTFFDTMKLQKLDEVRRREWAEEQAQQHEKVLQTE